MHDDLLKQCGSDLHMHFHLVGTIQALRKRVYTTLWSKRIRRTSIDEDCESISGIWILYRILTDILSHEVISRSTNCGSWKEKISKYWSCWRHIIGLHYRILSPRWLHAFLDASCLASFLELPQASNVLPWNSTATLKVGGASLTVCSV